MQFKKNDLELTDDILLEIIRVAKEVFCGGIYVPCDMHPCGWDFIDFNMIELDDEEEDPLEYQFELCDISSVIYDEHPYEDMTLREILEETDMKFEFER